MNKVFIILIVTLGFASAKLGLDVPIVIDVSGFNCLKSQGFDWVITRAYHSYGAVDTNAPITLRAAQQVGFKTDVYLFPCIGKDPR